MPAETPSALSSPTPARGRAAARLQSLPKSRPAEPISPSGGGRLTITATDGVSLAADLFLPPGAPLGAVLLAPAMAVPRRFYAPFARALVEGGLAVLTLDYRGVGESAPGSRAELRRMPTRLTDWADLDLAAAVRFLGERLPGVPRLFVGHSIGGQLLGLLDQAPFHGALLVGAQALSWKNWDGALRLAMAVFWFGFVPAAVGLVGYLPMKTLRQGDDLPPGIALDWGVWGRTPDMLARLAAARGGAAFGRLAAPVRSYAISDDDYAPRRGVEALARLFAAAPVELRDVEPRDVDRKRVGHFGFFRPAVAETLWAEARTWLVRAASR